ncbi:MAG TPA: hypothetical protein VKS60_01445, partial [Stellaceae bacterium]|nr:hypothetical protein [Stellaceae bacterium]
MRAVARGCRALAVALLLASSAAGAAAADTPDARAAAIVAAAAAATGGAAWDNLKEIHLTLHRQSGDDTADEEVWFDPHQGAAVVAIEDGPQAGRIGFDGKTAWSAESDGTGEVLKGAERADVIAETLWRSAVWIRHPPGGATWLRDEGQGTHAHDVIRIAAADAAVLEIAFDRANHLPVRVTVHRSDGDETMRLSQWRRTDGASLPWHIDIETANSRVAETVASAVGSAAFNAARFAVPTTPLVDYVFPGEALSAALPIKLLNGHVRLETHVGKQRLQTLFETGAKAALDPNAVQRLGLATHTGAGGETNVRLPEFGVGGVTLKHQTIAVRDLSPLAALEGVPVDAVIGVELARRLVVELDYEGRRMVLLRPDGFVAPPTATPVPLTFAGRIPTVTGRIDGIPATLSLDTGTAAGLVLGDGFAKAHGLVEKWHPVPALVAVGTTPPVLAQLGRAASLELGVLGVAQPLTWISAAPPPA